MKLCTDITDIVKCICLFEEKNAFLTKLFLHVHVFETLKFYGFLLIADKIASSPTVLSCQLKFCIICNGSCCTEKVHKPFHLGKIQFDKMGEG